MVLGGHLLAQENKKIQNSLINANDTNLLIEQSVGKVPSVFLNEIHLVDLRDPEWINGRVKKDLDTVKKNIINPEVLDKSRFKNEEK